MSAAVPYPGEGRLLRPRQRRRRFLHPSINNSERERDSGGVAGGGMFALLQAELLLCLQP